MEHKYPEDISTLDLPPLGSQYFLKATLIPDSVLGWVKMARAFVGLFGGGDISPFSSFP